MFQCSGRQKSHASALRDHRLVVLTTTDLIFDLQATFRTHNPLFSFQGFEDSIIYLLQQAHSHLDKQAEL